MAVSMRFHRGCVLGLAIFVICLALAGPVFGQLSLIPSTPADGDTGVDT